MKQALLKRSLAFLFAIGLSGCTVLVRTEPVLQSQAKAVPPERVLAFQKEVPSYTTLVVTRDAGFMGAGCYIGLVVSGTLAARFGPEETATFFVPPGPSDMAVVRDPDGRGLCSVGTWDPVPEHYDLKPDTTNRFRISLGAYRRPRLLTAPY